MRRMPTFVRLVFSGDIDADHVQRNTLYLLHPRWNPVRAENIEEVNALSQRLSGLAGCEVIPIHPSSIVAENLGIKEDSHGS